MREYTEPSCEAQPIRAAFKRILLNCIANADRPDDQKAMILIVYENGILSCPETFALIHSYGLEAA